MKRFFFSLFLVLSLSLVAFAQINVKGYVFLDSNGNGIRDVGEKGLSNVAISDGKTIVLTDADGRYTLQTDENEPIIFVSFPSGYFPKYFWKKVNEQNKEADFPLYKISENKELFIIQVSDIHSTFTDNCRETVIQFVKEANILRPDFVVATGDLVMDANPLPKEEDVEKYFQLYKSLMKDLKPPLFNLPGNHEHPWAIPESSPLYNRGAFKHFLGPLYYSFNYSNWHFVLLEATIGKQTVTGLDETQLNWLEKDLSLAKDKPTIIFTHQPPFECKNFPRFLSLIAQNKQVKVVFSGHEHANIYLPLGDILNILTGALSGSWWGDDKPNLDGTPRGYRLIISKDGKYETAYKWVGEKHSVDVPFLMREAALKGKVALKINVYDDDNSIEGVAVRVDSSPPIISLRPSTSNKLWKTYMINLDTTSFPNGEHQLTFYAVSKKAVDGKRLWKLEYPIKIENER